MSVQDKIIELSANKSWESARREWTHDIYCKENDTVCICGRDAEYSFSFIATNGNRIRLGSCCVRTLRNRLVECSACGLPGVHSACYYRTMRIRLDEKIKEIEGIVSQNNLSESAQKFASSLVSQMRFGKYLTSRQLEAWRKLVIKSGCSRKVDIPGVGTSNSTQA